MESDEQLISRINRGDLDAFETLYTRHRDWVYRLAYRFVRDHDVAQDTVQETFTYLLKKFPGFELTAKLTTFLYPMVKFTALQMMRQRRRGGQMADDDALLSVPAPEEADTTREELAKVLAVLPDEQREVLLMRYLDDLAIEEIAAILETPSGTIKSRIHRALNTLRENDKTRQYFLE